jgi:peroxiredoxin Q/BCP
MRSSASLALGTFTSLSLISKAGLRVGERAPDFALRDQKGKTVRLSDFSGKNIVVLAFYTKASTLTADITKTV